MRKTKVDSNGQIPNSIYVKMYMLFMDTYPARTAFDDQLHYRIGFLSKQNVLVVRRYLGPGYTYATV